MLGEQVVVAVVVQHAHTGDVRASGDDHVCWSETVMTDLSKFALDADRDPFDVSIDCHARKAREVRHHRRVLCA